MPNFPTAVRGDEELLELKRQAAQLPIDAKAVVVAASRPLSSEQKYRDDGPCRVKNAEPTT
jgi:hypothetical protein